MNIPSGETRPRFLQPFPARGKTTVFMGEQKQTKPPSHSCSKSRWSEFVLVLFQDVSFSGNTCQILYNSTSECKVNLFLKTGLIKTLGVTARVKRERSQVAAPFGCPTSAVFPLLHTSDFFFLWGNRGSHKTIQCLAPG